MKPYDKIKSRQKHNKELLKILSKAVKDNPDWRFSQILLNYNFNKESQSCECDFITLQNDFQLESSSLLDRVKANELVK